MGFSDFALGALFAKILLDDRELKQREYEEEQEELARQRQELARQQEERRRRTSQRWEQYCTPEAEAQRLEKRRAHMKEQLYILKESILALAQMPLPKEEIKEKLLPLHAALLEIDVSLLQEPELTQYNDLRQFFRELPGRSPKF